MNVGKLKARLLIVEPRLSVSLGQRLQTTSAVCRGLTFVGLLAENTKLRCVTYQLHRHNERGIEFQKTGQEVRNTEL